MRIGRALAPAIVLALALTGAAATAAADEALDSSPPGLMVGVRGPVSIGGIAPIPLEDLPVGGYVLQVDGPGYPALRGTLRRRAGGRMSVGGYDGPSALLLPPGIEHLRKGEKGRGLVLGAAGLAGLGVTLVEELDRSDASDALRRAQSDYDAAVGYQEVLDARHTLLAAHDRVGDAEEMRNLWAAMTGAVWVGSAVELWLLTPRPHLAGSEGRYIVGASAASPVGAGLRSLLVPGAGQRYMGHDARGSRFTAAVSAATAGALIAHQSYLDARRTQMDAQRRYDDALTRSDAELWRGRLQDAADRTDRRNRVQWALAGTAAFLHVWNIVDAARLVGADADAPAWTWNVAPEGDGFRAGLSWRID